MFLRNSNDKDVKQFFLNSLKKLDKKIIQVSMDGPNVNWTLFKMIEEKKVEKIPSLISIEVVRCKKFMESLKI